MGDNNQANLQTVKNSGQIEVKNGTEDITGYQYDKADAFH